MNCAPPSRRLAAWTDPTLTIPTDATVRDNGQAAALSDLKVGGWAGDDGVVRAVSAGLFLGMLPLQLFPMVERLRQPLSIDLDPFAPEQRQAIRVGEYFAAFRLGQTPAIQRQGDLEI